MAAILFSSLALTSEQLSAIGNVAVESTYCEQLLEEIIWALLELQDDQGKFITDRMLLDKRIELINDLWKPRLTDPEKLKTYCSISARLKEANKKRNTIIHGYWHIPTMKVSDLMNDHPFPPAVAIKRRLRSQPTTFSAENIQNVAEEIAEITNTMLEFAFQEGFFPSA